MTRRAVAVVLVLALVGCGQPQAPPSPEPASPPATPAATSLAGSPAPPPAPASSPVGDLSARVAAATRAPELSFRYAAMQLISDPGNPLGLNEEEMKRADLAFREFLVSRDQYDFRLTRLYQISSEGWEGTPSPALPGQAQEEVFLAALAPVKESLRQKASGTATPEPYPEELQVRPTDHIAGTFREEEAEWEKVVPKDRRLPPDVFANLLPDWAAALSSEQAARALAELEPMEQAVQTGAGAASTLADLVLADDERTGKVRDMAEGMSADTSVDLENLHTQLLDWLLKRQGSG